MYRTFALLGLALLSSLPATASEYRLTLDPQSTELTFLLKATGHDVHGTMTLDSGELRFDPETGAASGRLVMDARSLETGSKSRDKTMHKKVLNSETFPEFVFEAQKVTGAVSASGVSEIEVSGTLSIHGDSHEITFPVELEIDGHHFSAKAELTVPYVEWGMKDPSIVFLRVAKEVQVSVTAEGTLPDSADGAMEGAH